MNEQFIKNLFLKRSNYSDPDQATMQENSLEKLSSGIYTEGERFVFELLQNAVDAHSSDDILNISILMQDGYIIFMHNGETFTDEDIEGICFVGRKGDKVNNTKKIGYKGIGFKSVFGISSKVYIHTGNQCFRFDKEYWKHYWEKNWKSYLGPVPDDVSEYTMPWQVIPIESKLPICINEGDSNVATYIAIDSEEEQKLKNSVTNLMQSCKFLIFLKDRNIRMSFSYNGNIVCTIEKRSSHNEVTLFVNEQEDSRWMVYQNPEVPLRLTEEQKKRIAKHKNTPDKLKNAVSFDLSFAIALKDNKLQKTDGAVLYTYLPTSYKLGYGLPFLVNANFITDEGRQHLDEDAEWNKILISEIPSEYLRWVSTFSRKYPNYYEVLPKKSYGSGNSLLETYEEAMAEALDKIEFIPDEQGNKLLKVNDAFFDEMKISTAITPYMLIAHINRVYHKQFSGISNIISNKGHSILKSYGVFDFDKNKFKDLFNDSQAIVGISASSDAKLINLLYNYYYSLNSSEQKEFECSIQETKFILSQNNILLTPSSLCLSALQISNYSSDVDYINTNVYQELNEELIEWLKNIGVSEPSNTSLIETGKLFQKGYVTVENAIEIGRYFFKLYKTRELDSSTLRKLSQMPMLTQNRTLKQACQLFLSNAYEPELSMEGIVSIDMFISKDYIDKSPIYEWKSFLRSIGLSENIELSFKEIPTNIIRNNYSWALDFWETHKTQHYTSNAGNNWFNPIQKYDIYIFSLYEHVTNIVFAKIFWHEAFKLRFNRRQKDRGYAIYQDQISIKDNFFEWSISCKPVIPTTQHRMEIASNVFVNNLSEYCGNYLPVIDVESEIPQDWIKLLQLKRHLQIEDLLLVLEKISKEKDPDKLAINKSLIIKIYSKIAEDLSPSYSSRIKLIRDWALNNKILSKGDEFISPKDLSYITIDGFRNKNQVYIGKHSDKNAVLKLMSIMGVKIITENNVLPTFKEASINTDISTRLLTTLPALAVLARDCNSCKSYQEWKDTLQEKIENTLFFQCTNIALTYDNSGDNIFKMTFAQDGKFYFTGELRPAKIEPLLHPLCSYLGLLGKERELFVIMTEPNFTGIIEYLEDKEYDVTEIKAEMHPAIPSQYLTVSVGGQIGGNIDRNSQIADNNEAKSLVLAKLEKEGFDTSKADASWSVINGVKKNGITFPIVVKSCKNWDHKLFLNPEEWEQLFKPNSMLWIHSGNGAIAPIKAYELFTYQDKLTLTFDTVNLMMDNRINRIMEVMHYFNNVHLDVSTLNPNQHRADHLEEYLFNTNNAANSDLSIADID